MSDCQNLPQAHFRPSRNAKQSHFAFSKVISETHAPRDDAHTKLWKFERYIWTKESWIDHSCLKKRTKDSTVTGLVIICGSK